MSNLESAKAAIEAELSQAKQGLAYYESRVGTLEQALAQLSNIDGSTGTAPKLGKLSVGKRQAKAEKVKPVKVAKGKKGKQAKGPNDLPFTGGDYWPNLITDQPKSASEVLQTAISGLEFVPTPEQIKKLTLRMTFALNTLVKSNKIQDSGSGRERRFFKA